MYLVLGDLRDLLCKRLCASLKARGHQTFVVANPLAQPLRFTWRFDNLSSASRLTWEDGTSLFASEIAGVLVRSLGWISPDDWKPADLVYLRREAQAALLAWLWSLDCPIINRYPASLWYRLDAPLLFWWPTLEQSGLRALHSLVSNVEEEMCAFGASKGREIVYVPLTARARCRQDGDDHAGRLVAIQRYAPVHLTQAVSDLHLACVVGSRVVWQDVPPAEIEGLEPALIRFAAASGLTFVEVVLTLTTDGARVAAVNPYPYLERFNDTAQRTIVDALLCLFTEPSYS